MEQQHRVVLICDEIPQHVIDDYATDCCYNSDYEQSQRIDIWCSSRYRKGIHRFCAVVPSTSTVLTSTNTCSSRCIGDLVCVDKLLAVYGYLVTLYIDSSYIVNVFTNWTDIWLRNNYMTTQNSKVRHHELIQSMVSRGCRKIEYIDTTTHRHQTPTVHRPLRLVSL